MSCSPEPAVAVRATGLRVDYDGHEALRGVDLAVRRGRLTAIVGANGSGKSTLLAVLSGLRQPSGGRIEKDPSLRVSLVPQHTATGEGLPITVTQIVAMGRWAHRGWWRPLRRLDRERIAAAIAAVDLTPLARRPIGELSGGQRRRAFLAQALAQDAGLVLLDEPMAGLDADARREAAAALRALADGGAAVVAVTHDLTELGEVDDVVTLNDGRIAGMSGGPDCAGTTASATVGA